MWVSIVDPALINHSDNELATMAGSTPEKLDALLTHRRMLREFDIPLGATAELVAQLMEGFPWASSQGNQAARECVRFLSEDLQRATYFDPGDEVSWPAEWTVCEGIAPRMKETWARLLSSVAAACDGSDGRCLVGTWGDVCMPDLAEVPLAAAERRLTASCAGDENAWYPWLDGIDWWPDLHRWVRVAFLSDSSLSRHEMAREDPHELVVEDAFLTTVEDHRAHIDHRDELIRAITKRIYGILDKGLGDEQFQGRRRMRVTHDTGAFIIEPMEERSFSRNSDHIPWVVSSRTS